MTVSDIFLVLIFIAVLFLPGTAVCLAAELPRWTTIAAAPLVSYGLTVVTEQVCMILGFSFGPLMLLAITVLIATALLGSARLYRRRHGRTSKATADRSSQGGKEVRSRRDDLIIVGGVVLGAVLSAGTVLTGMGRLDGINQDWDASFHANAIRFILDTGNADPAALSAIYPQDTFFYPNAWHALSAVVGQLSRGSIPALLGTQGILVGGIAGLGLAALIRSHGGRVTVCAVVPLLLAGFSGFPIDVLWRGPLLPYAAGLALIPAFLLVFSDSLRTRRPAFLVVTAICAAGLLGLQPATALTAAIFAASLLIARWVQRPARIQGDLAIVLGASLLAGILGFTFVSGTLLARGFAAAAPIDWPAIESPGQAVGDLLFLNHAAQFPQYWLTLLILAGLVGFARLRAMWWFIAGTTVFAVLFVATAAYDAPLTESLSLPWWNDRFRFVAIVTLGLAVLAGHGLVTLADAVVVLARRIPGVRARPSKLVFGAAALAVLTIVGVGSSGFYAPYNADRVHLAYGPSNYLSAGERAGMTYLAGLVKPGERVMNDPKDGSVWMYALNDVEPVFGHVVDPGTATQDLSDAAQLLLASFNCLDTNEAVRTLIDQHNIGYVFVGQGFLRSRFERAGGLRGLENADSLDLVYAEEGVRIYKVDLVPLRPPHVGRACTPGRT